MHTYIHMHTHTRALDYKETCKMTCFLSDRSMATHTCTHTHQHTFWTKEIAECRTHHSLLSATSCTIAKLSSISTVTTAHLSGWSKRYWNILREWDVCILSAVKIYVECHYSVRWMLCGLLLLLKYYYQSILAESVEVLHMLCAVWEVTSCQMSE